MKTTTELERVFPLSAGSAERPALHAPRLPGNFAAASEGVPEPSALLRAWAARRAKTGSESAAVENHRASAASLR